jgi:hypothetical protein
MLKGKNSEGEMRDVMKKRKTFEKVVNEYMGGQAIVAAQAPPPFICNASFYMYMTLLVR